MDRAHPLKGGSSVTGYEYRYKTTGEFPDEWTEVPDGPDSGTDRSDERSYTVTGLDNGALHTFEVRAVSVVGEGAPATDTATPMTTPTLPLSVGVDSRRRRGEHRREGPAGSRSRETPGVWPEPR